MLVRAIREKAVDSSPEADIIITTAHKAKGSEFTQVKLAEDFIDLSDYDHMAESGKYKTARTGGRVEPVVCCRNAGH